MIDPRLVNKLEEAIASNEIGSLLVGHGAHMRQLFFAGDELYLIDAGKELRFSPLSFLLDNSVVPRESLNSLLIQFGSNPVRLAQLLPENYALSEEQKAKLTLHETVEELLLVLDQGADRFVFEAGNVPEEVLVLEDSVTGIPYQVFSKALRRREEEQRQIAALFPHAEELPVLTAEGSAQHAKGAQWLFTKVADLLDGFRDLRQIRKDCLFFPHLTDKLLVAALQNGWIVKERFPEFEKVKLHDLDSAKSLEIAHRIETSLKYAADAAPLRLRLVDIFRNSGDSHREAEQHAALGSLYAGRHKEKEALEAFRAAYQLNSNSAEVNSQLAESLEHAAEEAMAIGAIEEARKLFEEALPLRPQDERLQLRIVQSFGKDDDAAARTATRLAGLLHNDGQGERALRFLQMAFQCYPNSETLRRTYINFLLDHGLSEHAVNELEHLAEELLARGHEEEARQIYEKVARIDPNRVPEEQRVKLARAASKSPDRVKRRSRVSSKRRAAIFRYSAVALVVLVTVVGQQLWTMRKAAQIEQRAYALMSQPIPSVETVAHQDLRTQWKELIQQLDSIELWSVTNGSIGRHDPKRRMWKNRLIRLEAEAQSYFDDLYKEAERARLFGSTQLAIENYRQLIRLSEDAKWVEQAKKQLAELESSHLQARALKSRGDAALAKGQRKYAFQLYRRLVETYPSSESSAGILLPVQITTKPSGLAVTVHGKKMGKSPVQLELTPFAPVEITVQQKGGIGHRVTLDDVRDAEILIDLTKPTREQ